MRVCLANWHFSDQAGTGRECRAGADWSRPSIDTIPGKTRKAAGEIAFSFELAGEQLVAATLLFGYAARGANRLVANRLSGRHFAIAVYAVDGFWVCPSPNEAA